jgi:DNA repair exonuclease SbcCD nuclease subunit
MGFCFLHAADLHLDTPFSGLGEVAPHLAAVLRSASLDALERIVERALAEPVDLLLLAGDLYDGVERGVRAQLRLLDALSRLDRAGVHTFIVHGNHDPLSGWAAVRAWPERVHVFPPGAPTRKSVHTRSGEAVTVHGASFGRSDEPTNLAALFGRTDEPGAHIGLLHCNVGRTDHSPYAPCTVDDLARAGLDYWALGHVHRRQVVLERPLCVYPGNTQGRSFQPGELGAKGAVLVRSDDGRFSAPELVEVDRVRFLVADVSVEGIDDAGVLVERLREEGQALRERHPGRSLVVRARLLGETPLHDALGRSQKAELLLALRDMESEVEPFVWWAELRDETRTALPISALYEREDLPGEIVREASRLEADPRAVAQLLGDAPPPVLGLLRGLDDTEVAAVLRRARDLALARLLGEGEA